MPRPRAPAFGESPMRTLSFSLCLSFLLFALSACSATGGGGSATGAAGTAAGSSGASPSTGTGSGGSTGAKGTGSSTGANETGGSTIGAASTGGSSTTGNATTTGGVSTGGGTSGGSSSGTTGGPAPTTVGLVLWLQAGSLADGGVANGGSVSAWPDSSSTGDDAAQATAANQPTLVTGVLNGLPVVRFSQSQSSNLQLSTAIAQSAYTIVTAGSETDTRLIFLGGTDDFFGPSISGGDNVLLRGTGDVGLTLPSTAVTGGHVYSATVTDGGGQIWVDGQSIGSGSVPATSFSQIGCRNYLGAPLSQCSDGDVAEILVYDTALSDAQRQVTEAYLAAKYALP